MKALTQQELHADDGIVYCPMKRKERSIDEIVLYPDGFPILRRLCLAWQERGDCEGIVCKQKMPSEALKRGKDRR